MTEATVTPIDPIADLERQAQAELDEQLNKTDKAKLVASKRRIADAKKIVANLELEYEGLVRDLRAARG